MHQYRHSKTGQKMQYSSNKNISDHQWWWLTESPPENILFFLIIVETKLMRVPGRYLTGVHERERATIKKNL